MAAALSILDDLITNFSIKPHDPTQDYEEIIEIRVLAPQDDDRPSPVYIAVMRNYIYLACHSYKYAINRIDLDDPSKAETIYEANPENTVNRIK